jgi:hypothetical protein
VTHSHEYSPAGWLRRSFDEARAINEVYGWAAPADPATMLRHLRGNVGSDWRAARAGGASGGPALLTRSTVHHGARIAGAALGARADRLPRRLTEQLSLERRR